MDDSSLPPDLTIQIEIANQNMLQPKLLIDYHILKIFRIAMLGIHLLLMTLILFIGKTQSNYSKTQDLTFFILTLSIIYLFGVVIRNADKRPTTFMAGYFHAIWAFSMFSIIHMLFFTIPFHENPNESLQYLLVITRIVCGLALSADFTLNKLLLQKMISILNLVLIMISYAICYFFTQNENEDSTTSSNYVNKSLYLTYLLYFFIISTSWLLYLILHRHKYHFVKRKVGQPKIKVGLIKT